MAVIRVTVTASDDSHADDTGPRALAALAHALREGMDPDHRLTRLAGLSLPGAPAGLGAAATDDDAGTPTDRIFRLEMPDGDGGTGPIRALGGWLMRHPTARVAVKADGPSGGVSLRLDGWSAVSYAAAVARIQEQLATPPAGGGG